MALDAYTEYLTGLGLGEGTVYNYRRKPTLAAEVAASHGWDLSEVSPLQVAVLADAFPRSSGSRGILRAALAHYWQMCGVEGPAEAIRIPKAPPWKYRGLEDDEAEALEETALGWWPQGGAVLLGLYLALRRAEMASLRWEDFDEEMEWVTIMGKGERIRYLPVHEVLRDELAPQEGYLFPGTGRPFVHTGTVRSWIDKVAHTALGKTVAPHALRHTCLTRLNDETGDLRVVQAFAGHADPAQTSHYTRANETRMAEAVASLRYGIRPLYAEQAKQRQGRPGQPRGEEANVPWISRGRTKSPSAEAAGELVGVDGKTSTEAWRTWRQDRDRRQPDQGWADALYAGYADEGHLVTYVPVRDYGPSRSWVVFCSCGAVSPGPPISVLADWSEAKWWAAEHRTTCGLEVQEWHPVRETLDLDPDLIASWGL